MKVLLVFLALAITVGSRTPQHRAEPLSPVGRWQVKFTLLNSSEKRLVFIAQEQGDGSFQLLDTGPDNQPVAALQPATWSLTNDHLSFSGEVELPIGTCCREMGTLIFKSKLTSANSISGKLIFVTNVDEDESPFKYHSTVGTFTASREKPSSNGR